MQEVLRKKTEMLSIESELELESDPEHELLPARNSWKEYISNQFLFLEYCFF